MNHSFYSSTPTSTSSDTNSSISSFIVDSNLSSSFSSTSSSSSFSSSYTPSSSNTTTSRNTTSNDEQKQDDDHLHDHLQHYHENIDNQQQLKHIKQNQRSRSNSFQNHYTESTTDTSSNSSFPSCISIGTHSDTDDSGSSIHDFQTYTSSSASKSSLKPNRQEQQKNRRIIIESEPVGSIPRPSYLIEAFAKVRNGDLPSEALDDLFQRALIDTVHCFEHSGSKVITDGEQMKPSFITYSIDGSNQLVRGGTSIVFCDGHAREMPVLSGKNLPFRYKHYACEYFLRCKPLTDFPIKQPVISASAMSLLYPLHSCIPNYPREQFIEEMLNEVEYDIRSSLEAGAAIVQIDATEARLSMKLDPSGQLLREFIDLNNRVLTRFTDEERKRIGVHSCPGGDQDSTHSADISYELIIPLLFQLKLTRFYLEYQLESNKTSILKCIKECMKPNHLVFFGVINVLDPRVETPEEVCNTIIEIAKYIPIEQIGTTDDCGYSPFGDDMTTSRELAFAKIKARLEGTKLAEDYFNNQYCTNNNLIISNHNSEINNINEFND